MIDRLCGGIIFFRTASLRSLEYCMIRSSIAPGILNCRWIQIMRQLS
jgi:hypothetical protein